MEPAVLQPRPPPPRRYVVFDLSAAGLRCFSPPPAAEHIGVPFGTQVMGLDALRRTRLSRAADLAASRPPVPDQVGAVITRCDPDTVSDAATSGVQAAEEESENEVDSLDECVVWQEGFARKIDALAELVGIKGAYEPAAVLGEVVRVLQAIDKKERSV